MHADQEMPRYIMKCRQALIINIVDNPDEDKKRRGSNIDKEKLEATLKKLNYDVKVVPDSKGNEIIEQIEVHANETTKCDSYVCCILAHGEKGKVSGSDGVSVETKEITEVLKKVPHLRGKPKIIFFQACQGSRIPAPVHVLDNSAANSRGEFVVDTATPTLPPDSDFFYGCAASFETAAIRSEYTGSPYIQVLCKVLEEKHKDEDLVTMVTRVHYLVAGKEYKIEINKIPVPYKQQPQLISTLRKLVNFK